MRGFRVVQGTLSDSVESYLRESKRCQNKWELLLLVTAQCIYFPYLCVGVPFPVNEIQQIDNPKHPSSSEISADVFLVLKPDALPVSPSLPVDYLILPLQYRIYPHHQTLMKPIHWVIWYLCKRKVSGFVDFLIQSQKRVLTHGYHR